MLKRKTIPDADLSNAGDDFHILWTMKKSFDLLNFDEHGLKAIYIEGVENTVSKNVDPTGVKLLGIDLSEYYGSEEFVKADKVVISQLKYSTRRADKPYTYSELYKGKKNNSTDGSLIHRLSTIFKAFIDEYGRDLVLQKVVLKLVSNRSFNANQLQNIKDIQLYLKTKKREISFNKIIKDNPSYSKSLTKLFEASKLKLTEFTDFIRLLDFEDCGIDSRYYLKINLVKAISDTSITSRGQYNELFQLINNKTLPEFRNQRCIKVTDLIASLDFHMGGVENLFPVTQNFEKKKDVVVREQLEDILQKIEINTNFFPICIHGGAGIGKSTLVQQIEKHLPEYFECITFDCYGAGAYQNPIDKRHLHKYALLHLSNELAKRLGTDFLINKNEANEVYLKEFRKRIVNGIEILQKRNPKATLILIIDAADNSVTAANNNGERSFIVDLLNIDIPRGCNLIVTTRTYRKETLSLPDKFVDIEILPFSLNETRQFITSYYPEISDNEITDFHKYTYGIPRAQFYSIGLKEEGIVEIINFLKPNGKKVEDLILDKIEIAKSNLGKSEKNLLDKFFQLLITLPRPVPIEYLANILDVNVNFLEDISSEIWNGLIYENKHFEFRDEDFENYIRENYYANDEELKNIAVIFLSKSSNEEYASVNLGYILFIAKQYPKLKEIVLERQYLDTPKDPLRNREVYINRTKLAMKACGQKDDSLTFFKLTLIAAEESKTDRALTGLLIDYPDLVANFGDAISLTRLKLNSDEKYWAGSFHLKLAGFLSRNLSNKDEVLKHLKTARDWLNWRFNSKENEEDFNNDYNVSSLDIAFQTEAVLRLFGVNEALRGINRWSPRSVRLSSGNYLVENLLIENKEDDISKWINETQFSTDVRVFLICKLFKFNKKIDFNLDKTTDDLLKALRFIKEKLSLNFKLLIVEFSEILAYYKIDAVKIIQILANLNYSFPNRIPYFHSRNYRDNDEQDLELSFRIETLKASLDKKVLQLTNVYPERLKNIDEIKDYKKKSSLENDKREFTSFFKYVTPIFQLRANVLCNQNEDSEDLKSFEEICNKFEKDYSFSYENRHWATERLGYLCDSLAIIVSLLGEKDLVQPLILAFNNKANKLSIRFSIIERTIHLRDFVEINLQLFDELDDLIKNSALSSNDIVEKYIRCSLLARKIDKETGQYFFEEAIKAVNEIDLEAFTKINCLSGFTEVGIPKSNPQLAYEFSRFTEHCHVRLQGYDNFPYTSALKGIANLDLGSIYSIMCRWHQRDVISLTRYTITLLKKSLEKGYIDHLQASALLPLNSYHYSFEDLVEFYKLILSHFDVARDVINKTIFVKTLFRDCLLSQNKAIIQVLYDEIKSGAFVEQGVILEIKKYLGFRSGLSLAKKESNYKNDFSREDHNHNIDIENLDFSSTKQLEDVIVKILNNSDTYSNRWAIDNFLSDVKDKCTSINYVNHLNALVDINSELISFLSFEEALKERLEDWSVHVSVKKWKKEKFQYVLLNWFEYFDNHNGLSIWNINKFANMFNINKAKLSDAIVNIIPEKIEVLSDESIYSAFHLINERLSKEENERIIEWILSRWNSNIESNFADGIWCKELASSINSKEVLQQFLWFSLGQPDKRLRWRAMHSIRRLVRYGDTDILELLLKEQNSVNCFPFQNKNYIFYWISAKLYLWIAIERISVESPEKLVVFKDSFLQELKNIDLPHVLIKLYIKNTCLNIIAYDKDIYEQKDIKFIQGCLKSKLKKVKEKLLSRKQRKYKSEINDKWRFDFDTMDVLPYWYSSLARVFNLSEYDVADLSDKYIVENWGYLGDPSEDDYTSQYEWTLKDKRKGSNPTVEMLDTYFEYNAMFCSAHDLLLKEPQLENEYDDYWDSWEYWLESKSNAWDNFWLSDLRNPTPLENKFWKIEFDKFDEKWRDNIDEKKLDLEVLDSEINCLIPYAGYQRYLGENTESVNIRSALVSEKGSEALLRALQSAKNHHDYAFPMENSNEKFEINKYGFVYESWLYIENTEWVGLDVHDYLSKDTGKNIIRIGEKIKKIIPITFSENFKKGYHNGKLISSFQNWNEITDQRYRSSDLLESGGEILKIDRYFIFEILKKANKNLIIECQIKRQLKERIYNYDNSERPWEKTKLYLIKPDGKIKTIRGGNIKIR